MASFPPTLIDSQWTVQRLMDGLLNGTWTPAQFETVLLDSGSTYGSVFSTFICSDVRKINLLMASSSAKTTFGTDNTKQAIIKINQSNAAVAKLLASYISVDPTTIDNMTSVVGSSSQMNSISGPTATGSTACRTIIGATGAAYDHIKITDMAIAKYVAGSAGIDSSTISTTAGLAGSSSNMATVAGSTGGMAVAVGSTACMNTFAAGSTAMTAIVASTTGMSAIAGNSVAMTACDVDQAQTSITGSTTAFATFLASIYWPQNYTNSQRYGKTAQFGGYNGSALQTRETYRFATDVTTPISNLSTSARWSIAVGSNATKAALFGGFSASNIRETYLYSTDVNASLSALGTGREGIGVGSNSVKAALFGGNTGSVSNIKETYSYATDVNTVLGTTLTTARAMLGGTGSNSTKVFMCGGSTGSALREIYLYSTDLNTALSNLVTARMWIGVGSNSTTGIIAGGWTGSVSTGVMETYSYATDINTVLGTTLATTRGELAVASNPIKAFMCGGGNNSTGYSGIKETYTYSNNVYTVLGTTLATPREWISGAMGSNAHGGLYT